MKLVYIVGFPIDGSSGKNKATREKANALKNKVGINNFRFFSPPIGSSLLSKLAVFIIFDLKVFVKLITRKNDFVVIQRVLFMPLTRLLLYLKNVKVISEFHADFEDEIPHLNKTKLQTIMLRALVPVFNFNYKVSNGIIYNHPILKEKFDPVFKKPSIYSYNGSNLNEFYPENMFSARKKVEITSDEIVFLFLGSVSQWHGVDYLIDVFNSKDIMDVSNARLYIVGAKDNPYTRKLKSISTNINIKFIRPVSTEDARNYINACDFCLLPAKQIRISPGSPLKLYDYIACGKTVITQSNLRGYSDEVEKYKLGYTVDFTNSSDSAKKIITLLKRQSQKDPLHNRRVAVEHLSWDKRMDQWIAFLNKFGV